MIRSATEKGIADRAYRLVKIRAYSFHRTTGVPLDELESEGLLCYVLCLASYKSGKGVKFTTYLYSCLNNHLATFCHRWQKQLIAMTWDGEIFPDAGYDSGMEGITIYRESLSLLSAEAQGVAMVLEKCADEIVKSMRSRVKNPHSPKHLKGTLRRFLGKLGWKESTINRAFSELAEAFTREAVKC